MSDPMPGKTNDFVVRLEGLELDEQARNRISAAIQAAAMAELGRVDGGHQGGLVALPSEWLGMWLRSAAQRGGHPPQDFANKILQVTERR